MLAFRAWCIALSLALPVSLGCTKEVAPGGEAAAGDTGIAQPEAASADRSTSGSVGEVELPFGMDLEKGIPPWYVSGAGKIEVARMRQSVNDQSHTLTPCNRDWNPGAGEHTAKVLLRFTIGEEGHISEMSASENIGGDPALIECVVKGMSEMTFDPPPVGGEVTYEMPLYFAKR
jgi:hypothetical protein